jgi:hypothetical protein
MTDPVQLLLAPNYHMWYHPSIGVDQLSPVLTLSEAMYQANQLLEMSLDPRCLTDLQQECLARMVRVRWIYQNLSHTPIRKPVLAHLDRGQLVVDCGDTRLMALSLLSSLPKVSVLVTALPDQRHEFIGWQQITGQIQLFKLLDLDPRSAHLFYTRTDAGTPWAVSWLEIGDNSTSHHLHDTRLCVDMLCQELTAGFRFTDTWFYD